MNAPMRAAILSLAVLGLAACASMDERASMDEQASQVAPQETITAADRDAAYMARVEHLARVRGIEVIWVNPPQKKSRMVATK